MARQKSESIVGTIESLERLEDSRSGWGKFKVYLEDYDEEYPVALPADLNEEGLDLEEGMELRATKGPFKDWVVSKSTFENYEVEEEDEPPKRKSRTTSSREKPSTQKSTTRSTSKSTPSKGSTKSSSYDDWNKYQIEQRDPKMETQDYLKIIKDVYVTVIANGLDDDPDVIVDDIIAKAKDMYDQMNS